MKKKYDFFLRKCTMKDKSKWIFDAPKETKTFQMGKIKSNHREKGKNETVLFQMTIRLDNTEKIIETKKYNLIRLFSDLGGYGIFLHKSF